MTASLDASTLQGLTWAVLEIYLPTAGCSSPEGIVAGIGQGYVAHSRYSTDSIYAIDISTGPDRAICFDNGSTSLLAGNIPNMPKSCGISTAGWFRPDTEAAKIVVENRCGIAPMLRRPSSANERATCS